MGGAGGGGTSFLPISSDCNEISIFMSMRHEVPVDLYKQLS